MHLLNPEGVMDKRLDLAWGAKAIGEEIGLTEPQAHYALKAGLIRSARHVGKKWVADRQDLRREFSGLQTPAEGAE
jgi:hypothetical protein